MSATRSCPTCSTPLPADAAACPNCATTAFSATRALNLPEISGYHVLERIGEGGMGAIYLAEETSLGRRVAIKVVSGKLEREAQAHARFVREARALATIEHANVVRIYSFGEVDGQPYLAMEYIDGETLAERIRRLGRLPVEEALRFTRQILLALDAAWEKGIVHRDIKPSNVLIDRRAQVHVADFGLAKVKQVADDMMLTQSGHVLGTPYYVAPEQAQGKTTDFRSDIYSCGILLYEMLAGERPFEGTTPFTIVAKHLNEPLPSIRAKRGDVPNRVARLLERMTAKNPDERPRSYAELVETFDALLGITPSKPIVGTETFSTVPIATKGRYRTPLIISALVLLSAFGWQMYRARRNRPKVLYAPQEGRLVVAVTPFYGPEDESAREGRVMAAMVERSITSRLGAENVKVVGIDETKQPVRSHDAARQLGERFGAAVVVWGEAFALKGETEIQPYFTLVRRNRPGQGEKTADAKTVNLKAADPVADLMERSSGMMRMQSEAPNQIELRKTSAEGVGQMVSFLAAVHALYNEENPRKALQFFSQGPRTAESLRHWANAHQRVGDQASAMKTLEAALALEPQHTQSRAQLADLYLLSGRFNEAAADYLLVAASLKPYTTSQAIAHGGALYVREMFRDPRVTNDEPADTGALLAVSPQTGTVSRRWRLPGIVDAFESQPDGFRLRYAADRGKQQIETLTFRGNDFDRLPPPGGNLLLRMRGMKVAWVLPVNFMGEFTGVINDQAPHPRFRLNKNPIGNAPQTLPQLEASLHDAARRDPTQPWHLFFLGQTLLAEGRKQEAEATWETLLRNEYPGALYSNFAWMSKYFERLEQRSWADRAYEKALRERRRMRQPIQIAMLIERLINAPIARLHPEQLKDPERSYRWWQRSIALSGPTEGDHYAAAAWAGYFRRHGDATRARVEKDTARRLSQNPFNFVSLNTLADYALYGFFAAWISLVGSALLILHRANRGQPAVGTDIRRRILSLQQLVPRRWLPSAAGFAIGGSGIVITGLIVETSWAVPLAIALLAIAIVFALHATSLPAKPTIAFVSTRDRVVLLLMFLLFAVAAVALDVALSRIDAIASMPLGVGDSLGHPVVIADLESRLQKNPTRELQHVTAVANQLGGNIERAKSLDPEIGSAPAITMPSTDELFRAYTAGSSSVLRHLTDWSGPWTALRAVIGTTFVLGLALLLAMAFIRPAEAPPLRVPRTRAGRQLARISFVLAPGSFDLRRRSPLRGAITLMLFAFLLLLALGLWKAFPVVRSPGILTAMAVPNIRVSSALPRDLSMTDLMFAPPFALQFWVIAAVAVVALFVLHVSRIPAILALFRDEPAPDLTAQVTSTDPQIVT